MRCVLTLIAFLSAAMVASAQETVLPPLSAQQTVGAQSAPAAQKADALLIYNQGRSLDLAGKRQEAADKYRDAIAVCEAELAIDPARMDAYAVKAWSLFRLERYREVVTLGNGALKIRFDPRIVEVMGEAYFHLGDDAAALKHLQRYIENVGEFADRVATAYFYMAESYLRLKQYDHADIAYALAVHREPAMARWWYRYGTAVEALGEYSRAFELYAKALRLSPGMKEALDAQARVKSSL